MASDEEINALIKVTLRQKVELNAAFSVLNDFARFIEPTLERCHLAHCKNAATVKQVDTHIKLCDGCAARAIYLSRQNLDDTLSGINVLRIRCASTEHWIDLPNAVQIRRLKEYVWELRKNEEPDPPADPSELH
jgi:hypothetical protein